MGSRSKVLLASTAFVLAVALAVPALAVAASPRDVVSGGLRSLPLRGISALSVGAQVTVDDDIPGVPLPASPFSDTLQGPQGFPPYVPDGPDPYDVYAVTLTAGQSFYVEMTGTAGTDFDLTLFAPGSSSRNDFDKVVAWSAMTNTSDEELMYTADAPGTYYLMVDDWTVDPAAPGEYTLTYGFPTKQPVLTAAFGSKSLPFGGSTTVTGTVTFEGAPRADNTVVLLSKAYGAADWRYARETTTAADGSYSFSVKPTGKTAYMVFSLGDLEYIDVATTPVWVSVKAWVGNPAAPTTMYVNKAASVWALLKPQHSAGSYPVRIYKYRYVSGTWKSYGYVNAKAANYSSYTRATASVKLPYRGRWRLRAYHSDAGHLATYSSGYDYVTVK